MIQRRITLGPIHPWLPGAMKLELALRGDQIVTAEASFGFAGKDIQNKIKGIHFEQASFFVSRIEPESALLVDRLFFESLEKALQVPVEERAIWIRNVSTLIHELSGLLKYLAQMADVLGLRILKHIMLKHREELLDLIELFSGSRYGYYFITMGGARYDLTDGFVERLEAWTRDFQKDYPRIHSMFLWTHSVQNRLRSLGRIMDDGTMAFVSEAAVENTRYGLVSQVESRLIYALTETNDLSEELRELMSATPEGKFRTPFSRDEYYKVREPKVDAELVTSRGRWKMNLEIDSDQTIQSLVMSPPSQNILKAIPLALEGEQLEDIPVILQSLNFLVTEIDQ